MDTLFPKMEGFARKIDDYRTDNKLTREVVRKLDESVSMKVNKEKFTEMKYDFERQFISAQKCAEIFEEIDSLKQ